MDIDVFMEFCLIRPYSKSIETLHDWAYLRGFKILFSSSDNEKSVVCFPAKLYKTIFKKNPVLGEIDVPKGAEKFIESIKITKIKGK